MARAKKVSSAVLDEIGESVDAAREEVSEDGFEESNGQEPEVNRDPPVAHEPNLAKAERKKMSILNAKRANQTIYGVSGKPCVFDSAGVAEVGADDFAYLLKVPGYTEA